MALLRRCARCWVLSLAARRHQRRAVASVSSNSVTCNERTFCTSCGPVASASSTAWRGNPSHVHNTVTSNKRKFITASSTTGIGQQGVTTSLLSERSSREASSSSQCGSQPCNSAAPGGAPPSPVTFGAIKQRQSSRLIPCSISQHDLEPVSSKFDKMQRVLSQRLTHATTPAFADKILRSNFLRGGPGGSYDGVLFDSDAPPSAFTQLRPESEGLIYPFTLYPRFLESGSHVTIVTFDMRFLASDEYLMFHHRTDRVVLDPRLTPVAQSQVAFVHRDDKESLAFATREFVPLDKRNNAILQHSNETGWSCATRFLQAVRHNILVVFLGGLRLDASMAAECLRGKKIAQEGGRFYCTEDACQFSSTALRNLKDHYRRCHAGVKYVCEHADCGKTFTAESSLQMHRKTAHDEHSRLHCRHDGCRFTTKHPWSLEVHQQKHKGVTFPCDQCEFVGDYAVSLAEHRTAAHRGIRLVCQVDACGMSVSSRSHLLAHEKAAHRDHFLHCDHPGCDFSTKNEWNLMRHKRIHTVKPQECTFAGCSFETTWTSQMLRHVLVKHSGQEFICAKCSEKFTTPEGLTGHIRVRHEGLRLFCNHVGCGYDTGYRQRLVEHRNVLHQGRVLQCSRCTFSCLYQRQYDAHRRACIAKQQKQQKHQIAMQSAS